MANEATIDELQIEISASSASAASNLDTLANALDRLQAITSRITGGSDGLNKVAKQIEKLDAISQKIKSMQGFEKLGKMVDQLSKLDRLSRISDFSGFIRNANKLPPVMNALAQMPSIDGSRFQRLADALKPLQSANASGINSLMNALRKLPKLSQELSGVDFTRLTQQIEQISRAIEPLTRQAERAGQGLTAIAQIMQSTSRQARQSASGFGLLNQTIGNIKVKTLAAFAALRRLFSALKSGVTASAAYVENLNLFSVTMGDSADEALRFAESVNAALGVDTSDWIRYQGVFQSIGKGFGIVSEKADVMSKNLTQMSYDLSSFYNISVDTAAMKLQSAMSGEIMPMRQLGFAIDEATLKQVALNHGIEMSVENMTQAQKAQLRYVAIMEQAGNIGALGDMARTIDTAANGMRVFEARIQQFSRAVGNMLMPMLSAVLPYATAFVQVLTEGAQAIANLFGFELPKIDFSDAQVSSGFDDITGAIDEATEANEKFKGSLASIDQLNIIGSESESKNASGSGNSFDLGIELPEYDFLQGVESKTKQIAEDIKNWFKEVLPWIEAVGAAIGTVFLASKVNSFIGFLDKVKEAMTTIGGLVSGKFGKAAQIFSGIAGGLAAGVSSGILFHNGIKNLISDTGDLTNNIKQVAAASVIGGVAVAAFAAAGNPLGAALTIIGAAVGIVSGAIAGANEEVAKNNEIIERNMLFMDGTATITEIADAFGNWADKATEVNNKLTAQYDALEGDRTKITELQTQIEELAGVKINFNELTPANAETLKAPFAELATYLKTDLEDTAKTVSNDLSQIFASANITGPLVEQVTKGYQEIIDTYGSNIDKAQATIDQYLTKIADNGVLTEAEQQDFQRSYSLIMSEQNIEDMADLDYAIKKFDELDLSNINFESDTAAQEKLQSVIDEAGIYQQSIFDRLEAEEKNLMVTANRTQELYKGGWIDEDKYNSQMALLAQSEEIFRANAVSQLTELGDMMSGLNTEIDNQVREAGNRMSPDVYDKWVGFLGALGEFDFSKERRDELAQGAAMDKYLNNSAINLKNQELQNSLIGVRETSAQIMAKINTDDPIIKSILTGTPAAGEATITTTPVSENAKMNDIFTTGETTGTLKMNIITESEAAAGIKATSSALGDTTSNIDYKNVRKAVSNSNGEYSQSYSQATPNSSSGTDVMEANLTIYNYLEMDGDIIAEKMEERRVNMERRMNAKYN